MKTKQNSLANNASGSVLAKRKKFRNWDLAVFMGPYLITFFAFSILPVFVSFFLSFTNFNMLEMPDFVGLQNYIKMFLNDEVFSGAVQTTIILGVITGPVGYIMCFAFAWLLNEVPAKPRSFLTLLFYAPSLAGGFVSVWTLLFSGDSNGFINAWLIEWGMITEPIVFLKDTGYMFTVCVIIILWQSLGMSFLTFISGLQTVDKSLYEAGAVDGIKNRWQELYFITLPYMRGQLMFGAIMSITGAFNVGSLITSIFGYPTQDYALQTIMNHLDDYGSIRYEMGYASTIAVFLFVLSFVANKLIQFLLSKIGK